MACWSSGMIPVLGTGGPGFKSRTSPTYSNNGLYFDLKNTFSLEFHFASLRHNRASLFHEKEPTGTNHFHTLFHGTDQIYLLNIA